MADEPKQHTLYAPDGAEYTTTVPSEAVRLRAAGYRTTPPFDPAEHNVDEVVEHLTDHPEDAPRVLTAEKAGKKRTSIVGDDDGKDAGKDGANPA